LGPINVVVPASHDTGSAVAGVPARYTGKANWAYLSSGTWSLLGVELPEALLSPRVLELNFTNEGGVDSTYRLLKNIMGLWLLQQCRRAFNDNGNSISYEQLVQLASDAAPFRSLVDPDDSRFLNPPDMPKAIQEFCRETSQPVPESAGQFARCVFESLALKYAATLDGLEELTGTKIEVMHIVGGGSQNKLLNQFAANASGRTVLAGPVEATVFGNVLVQARSQGEIRSLADIRSVVRASRELGQHDPADTAVWSEARGRFTGLCQRKAA
jgi:rhamnulokinase